MQGGALKEKKKKRRKKVSTFFGGCGKISAFFFNRVFLTPLVTKRPKT
jgi:hypothetical protein